MALWTDLAEYVGPTPNHGGHMVEQRGMVLHIMAGTYDGSIAWGKNPQSQISFHFAIRRSDGHIGQLLDTDVIAWTQRDGNGHWASAENEGYLPQALTDAQIEANAKLFARGHKVYGWPLQIANSPTDYGLGHHSMGAENGYNWGHSACPGEAIKAQKPLILARAIEIVNGVKEDDMPGYFVEVREDGTKAVWATNGTHRWHVLDMNPPMKLWGIPFPTVEFTTKQMVEGLGVEVSGPTSGGGFTFEQMVEAARQGAELAEDS